MSEKIKRDPINKSNLPKCWGFHSEKSKKCLDCYIVESCFVYKEM